MDTQAMSAEEKKWRAESDARTLMEAEVIKADAARLKAAKSAAAEMLKEAQDRAKAAKRIAGKASA